MEYLHRLADELECGINRARTADDTPSRDLVEGVDMVAGVLHGLQEQRLDGTYV